MLIKHLLPKCSAFLGSQGKNYASLWRHTVRRYGRTDSSGSSDLDDSYVVEDEKWHKQIHTCRPVHYKSHSPIDILTDKAVSREYAPISFFNYDKEDVEMGMANNGTVVTVEFNYKEPQFTGAGMLATYLADHLHFHWGKNSVYGSEHYMDSVNFPMEMHIVHFNERYPNLATAEGKPDGISVLAFLLEKTREPNNSLSPITDLLKEIKDPFSSATLPLPSVMCILPDTVKESIFYQYVDDPGSGNSTISWIVFKDTIKISETQLAEFRKLNSSKMDEKTGLPLPLCDNNRTPQFISNLRVFTNAEEKVTSAEAPEARGKGKSLRGVFSRVLKRITKKH